MTKCLWHTCKNTCKNKYCSKDCKNKFYVDRRRRKIKIKAVLYKGGMCEICGYDKSLRGLTFHHKNPEEKDFGIGTSGHSRSWERTKEELDKCLLLCANCHAEIHDFYESERRNYAYPEPSLYYSSQRELIEEGAETREDLPKFMCE